MRRLAACLAAFALLAAPASAQSPADAEAAVRAYSAAFVASDWDAAAAILDPRDLARFAEFVDEFSGLAADELGDAAALAEADTPEDAFVAFMDLMTTTTPMFGEMMASVETEVLGSVAEADTLVHVVVRTGFSMFDSEVTGLEVTTARWDGARWVIRLSEQMDGVISAMETMAADPSVLDDYEAEATIMVEEWPGRDPKKRQ